MLFVVLIPSLLQLVYSLLGLFHRERQRGQKAQDVGRCSACKHVLVVYKVVAEILDRHVVFHTNHQSLATHVGDVRIVFLHLFKLANKVAAHLGSIVNKAFFLNNIKHCKGVPSMP